MYTITKNIYDIILKYQTEQITIVVAALIKKKVKYRIREVILVIFLLLMIF